MRVFLHLVNEVIRKQAARWGIRLYRFENVGNHIHILLRCFYRNRLNGFLRSVTGLVARKVLGAERGRLGGSGAFTANKKFWDARPFSRILTWGKEYQGVQRYFDQNRLQAVGFDLTFLSKTNLARNRKGLENQYQLE